MSKRRPRAFLLAPVLLAPEAVEPSMQLDARQRRLLEEALRRGEATGRKLESHLVELGQWILDNIFDGDASAALMQRRTNRVWHELTRRAGSPSLRMSERLLHVALSIAAHDQQITDVSWRALDPGRKEILLPLAEPKALRAAAQRVVDMQLTQRATRDLVRKLRQDAGKPPSVRTNPTSLARGLRRMSARLATIGATSAIETLEKRLDDSQRRTLLREIEALETQLRTLARGLKK